ncbi:MAG: YggS family pyridoxal phosphate-dependent enzyme [Bacteroidales bacterium]|nr:YggS family pyridoxal phosphate-dependent enzyme [Bacteroidales bacterium]
MISEVIKEITSELPSGTRLVAVSKFHPCEAIVEAWNAGQRIFGENRPQELEKKMKELPEEIVKGAEFHFLGHLQTNKLKMVLPYVKMVQSIDTVHLLEEVDKWCVKNGKVMDVLLEMHIGAEETKQGFYEEEILDIMFNAARYKGVRICGLMGMASHTDNEETIAADFQRIRNHFDYVRDLFPENKDFKELSIGMSEDYRIALKYGATFIRVGSKIFGPRVY